MNNNVLAWPDPKGPRAYGAVRVMDQSLDPRFLQPDLKILPVWCAYYKQVVNGFGSGYSYLSFKSSAMAFVSAILLPVV